MTFTSPHRNLRIVVIPARHKVDASGGRYLVAGKKAVFKDGIFKTEDKEIIDGLMSHKDLGYRFHAEGVKADKEKVEKKKAAKKKLAKKTTAESTNKKAPEKK